MKKWDVFVSHASEDKETVAVPLTAALRSRGIRVWLDKFELQIGDSLRAKIDEGLANCRHGVVVLSENFFRKHWTGIELDGIFANREISGGEILPIWYGVNKSRVRQFSPSLAGLFAGDLSHSSLPDITNQLAQKILSPRAPNTVEADVAEFAETLASGDSRRVRNMLLTKTHIVGRALKIGRDDVVHSRVQFPQDSADFCIGAYQRSSRLITDWKVLTLGPLESPMAGDAEPTAQVQQSIAALNRLRDWVRNDLRLAREIVPGIKSDFLGIVLCGRRPQPNSRAADWLYAYNDLLSQCQLRSYDWLLDSLLEA